MCVYSSRDSQSFYQFSAIDLPSSFLAFGKLLIFSPTFRHMYVLRSQFTYNKASEVEILKPYMIVKNLILVSSYCDVT